MGLQFFHKNYVVISNVIMRDIFFYLIFLLSIVVILSCNGPFPVTSKPDLPEDHKENIGGFLHKKGFEYPFKISGGCDDSKCHQDDLDGGVADIEGRITIAPSCFQCHETLWEDDIDGE